MRKETYNFNGENIERITRNRAKRLFQEGRKIYAAPVKMNLASPWAAVAIFEKRADDMNHTFEKAENAMIYYNCNNEAGLYLKYFEIVPDMDKLQNMLFDDLMEV